MTFNYSPFVSVIIPCRNEKKFILKCLDSLIKQDYPKDKMEILVADGRSEDGSGEMVREYAEKYSFVKLLDNPKKFTPFGLNIGIKNSKGEVIVRIDAHADYEGDYVSKCVKYLKELEADNVGGVLKTLPAQNTIWARAIAFSLSSPFGAGGSYFRTGSKTIREVDTVFGGCFKRKVFDKVGLYNEKLRRSQDFEFNKRLKKAGGKIFLIPETIACYYPPPRLKDFLKHNFTDGFWVTYPLKFNIRIFSWRHLIPLVFLSTLIVLVVFSFVSKFFFLLFLLVIIFYFLVSFSFSFKVAGKEKDIRLLFVLPVVFAIRHFGYGAGSILGLVKIYGKKKRERN